VQGRDDPVVVAIDGPAGSGKSTLAERLAVELELPYVNTGLMYRAVTLRALREAIDPNDEGALTELARGIVFDLDPDSKPPRLRIDGRPPELGLGSAEVEGAVSRVARHPALRALLCEEQRRLGAQGAVMEGRDIGSVVFPGATLRVLLLARHQARATRRALERESASVTDVERAIAQRDELDAGNVPAPESDLQVDTTDMDPQTVFEVVLAAVRERLRGAS